MRFDSFKKMGVWKKYSFWLVLAVVNEVIGKYIGANAFRFAIVNVISPGSDFCLKVLLLLGLIVMVNIFEGVANYFYASIAVKVSRKMHSDILKKILLFNPEEMRKMKRGEVTTTLTTKIECIETALQKSIPKVVFSLVFAVSIVLLMMFVNPLFSLIVSTFCVLIWLTNKKLLNKEKFIYKEEIHVLNDQNNFLINSLRGVETIRVHEAQDRFTELSDDFADLYKKKYIKKSHIISSLAASNNLLLCLCIFFTLLVGMIFYGSKTMLAYNVAPIVYLEMNILYLFRKMDDQLGIIQMAREYYMEIQREYSSDLIETLSQKIKDGDIRIELKNVFYRYDDKNEILRDNSMVITQGERVAILGNNGSGKSTLLKVLSGFYMPREGEVCFELNGEKISAEDYANYIAYVHQDYYVMNIKLIELLRLANEELNDTEIKNKARYYGFDNIFQSLRDGYDTVLGENGDYISGGERQLINIFMALLKDARVVILDECISALEERNREKVLESLNRIDPKTTIIMTEHDEIVRRIAKRMMCLDGGVLSES